jgi:gliding motility-associated-like protein
MIDLYRHDASLCPDVLCQGRTLLGQTITGPDGMWSFDVSAWPGSEFTAIAQDAMGNSSEFSACVLDPNVIASNTGPFCLGDTIFLFSMLDTAVGNVTFQWFGPNGYTSTMQNPVDAVDSGRYTVVADIMGCGADTAFTDVEIYPIASDTLRQLCIEDSIVVNGTVYNANNPFGIEVLEDVTQNGCDSIVVVALEFDFSLSANIFSTLPRACFGDSVSYWFNIVQNGVGGGGPFDVVYTAGGQPDTAFGIYDGHSQKVEVISDIHFEVLEVITDQTICTPRINVSDSIMVSALNISPIVTNYDGFGVSCFGENDGMITLNVTGSIGAVNYDWNLSALNGDLVSNLTAGNYAVTVSDEAGCTLTFDTLLTQPPMFESITRTQATTCAGINDGVIFVDAILGARGPVEYSIDGGPFVPVSALPLQISGLSPGVTNMVLRDTSGCTDDLSIFVPLGETPGVDLGTERSILSGDSVLLNYSTSLIAQQIAWDPSAVVSCATCPVTYAFPSQSQFISVTLIDSSGCVASDSVLILVFVPKQIYIPNVFSPNGDNINDVFYLQSNLFALDIEYLIIADRWGNVVFEKTNFPINDPAYGWDGTLDGKDMFPAVFTYLARIRFSDGEVVPHSGTVTLIR